MMPMMNVRIVRVSMLDRLMHVVMRMWLVTIPGESVRMQVMGIVNMRVLVLQELMIMEMCVNFSEMQPYARSHEEPCDHQASCRWRSQSHGQGSAYERCQREIGAGARGTEIAQRQNKQRQTEAIAHKAERPCLKQQRERGQLRAK